MTVIEAIIQGLVQGIIQGLTEFLPVSSSGHLSLYQYFTRQGGEDGTIFAVLLHLGTLIAVFIAFWKTIWKLICEACAMLRDVFTGKFTTKNMPSYRRMALLLIVSLLPMFFALPLLDFYKSVAGDQDIIIEGICFLITSALLFLTLRKHGRKHAKEMSYRDALAVGFMQALAPLPGISRSGSTIAVGLLCGLDRKFAIQFSFIMSIPTILAATLLDIREIVGGEIVIEPVMLVMGLITSLIFGLIAIRLVRWLATSDKFKYFAWYTMVIGVAVIIIGTIEHLANQPIQRAIIEMMAR